MKNKLSIFSILFFVSIAINAQYITLKKMGTFRKKNIGYQKNYTFTYSTDTGNIIFKGKIGDYEFPYLIVDSKPKPFIIDVRNITHLKYNSDLIPPNILALLFTTDFSVLLTIESIKEQNLYLLASALPSEILSYFLIRGFKTRLDTKNKWSFINPKESK